MVSLSPTQRFWGSRSRSELQLAVDALSDQPVNGLEPKFFSRWASRAKKRSQYVCQCGYFGASRLQVENPQWFEEFRFFFWSEPKKFLAEKPRNDRSLVWRMTLEVVKGFLHFFHVWRMPKNTCSTQIHGQKNTVPFTPKLYSRLPDRVLVKNSTPCSDCGLSASCLPLRPSACEKMRVNFMIFLRWREFPARSPIYFEAFPHDSESLWDFGVESVQMLTKSTYSHG